jgi:hypothetical protein
LKRRELPDTHPLAKAALAPFAHEHADVALMVASTWVILSCFVLKPDALTGAYGSFLNKHGGKTKAHYAALRAMALASTAGRDPPCDSYRGERALPTGIHRARGARTRGEHGRRFAR